MAAFVGFIVGENKIHFPWAIQGGPSPITYEDIANAGGAAAQWDAVRAAPPFNPNPNPDLDPSCAQRLPNPSPGPSP